MIGKYCGDSIPPSHISSSNEVLIHFQSDGSSTRAGFQMEYQPIGKQNNADYHIDHGPSSAQRCVLPVSFPVVLPTMAVMNPLEKKLEKRTSVQWFMYR